MPRIAQMCPELPKMPRIAQNYQKCPKCPELPRFAQNCPNLPEMPKIAQNYPDLPRIGILIYLPKNSERKFFGTPCISDLPFISCLYPQAARDWKRYSDLQGACYLHLALGGNALECRLFADYATKWFRVGVIH